jgi:hypothetical protein
MVFIVCTVDSRPVTIDCSQITLLSERTDSRPGCVIEFADGVRLAVEQSQEEIRTLGNMS